LLCQIVFDLTIQEQSNVGGILKTVENMGKYVENVRTTLDSAVHGHASAKRQIERIIGQWITGESSGYCFGFEGPPGVGKTSLAKYGLAKCLTNENGESRPFAFIAMGGSSNGSTLEGHNYTYVGSTWGKIVDILMDKKCMNPIIFIDELDKISNTDHGREIVGILTHLIDSTQNDCFQDKYFSGIDLDLSKALFIFSYNNPEAVDRILLDRIHRIKFKHMTLDEKLTICSDYLLPEMYKKMGLSKNVIQFSEGNLKYIIERYTCEPGVRKLKELLFEIVGEMNIHHIKNKTCIQEFPITMTNEELKLKFLKERHEVRIQKIPPVSSTGVINGLWANAVGQGGIIPIEAHLFPCDRFFDLKLTGMQGDVMKESMNVAKTLAWSLLTETEIETNLEKFSKTKMQGIHIHCPEGATPKDGPSAGTFPIPQPVKTDLAMAKKFLADAGMPNGFSTTFSFNVGQAGTAEPMSALLKESLAKIGITVDIQKLPDAHMSTLINEKMLPFFTEGVVAWLPSMDYFYRNFYIGNIRWNYSSLNNAQVTEMAQAARFEPDAKKYADYGLKLNALHFELMPQIPIWQPSQDAVMQTSVEGYTYQFHRQIDFRDLSRK
jgi:hypothetical protein